MPLPLLAIPGLIQAGVGLFQNLRGKNRADSLQRPERTTPNAIQEAVARTRLGAQSGRRPGSDTAREGIGTTQAATVSQVGKAGGSAATTMAAALGAQANANKATQQQDTLDAQYRDQMNMQYLNQLQNLGREQAANWQWNEAQKFQEEADSARRLQESGLQNLMGGVGEVAGMGFMQKMGYLDGANTFGDLFKGKGAQKKQAVTQTQTNYANAASAVAPLEVPQPYQYQAPNLLSTLQGLPTYGTKV